MLNIRQNVSLITIQLAEFSSAGDAKTAGCHVEQQQQAANSLVLLTLITDPPMFNILRQALGLAGGVFVNQQPQLAQQPVDQDQQAGLDAAEQTASVCARAGAEPLLAACQVPQSCQHDVEQGMHGPTAAPAQAAAPAPLASPAQAASAHATMQQPMDTHTTASAGPEAAVDVAATSLVTVAQADLTRVAGSSFLAAPHQPCHGQDRPHLPAHGNNSTTMPAAATTATTLLIEPDKVAAVATTNGTASTHSVLQVSTSECRRELE